ncbi:type IX secretion system PorP/SprF family membrane protein [Rhabdobacter roseus]|uniref:Type IX secretion system PorP/SprF family membrane protein n=1 Tax=Rhabdobacter roseus TaxID=1655419 RepID=A0A840TU84_9BACT|nr:type IX secretion system membrane protein PorP/SprF [Rhabdobacter roseus]MBB5287511.1 type IX secretion system PorP/SprF family membrane protein [Rhabdobacter roseus]
MIQRFKTFYTVAALLTFSHWTLGQQAPQFSLFSLNQLYYNPAAAGADGVSQLQITHRAQYAGYQSTFDPGGAPSSQLLTASVPLKNFGIGFYALNDRIGALSSQDIQLSAAYRIPLNEGNLSVGARAGLLRKALDYNQLRPYEPGDDIIPTGVAAQMNPDVSVGLRYERDSYYVGLSANHLLRPKYQLGTESATNPQLTTYYLNAGLLIEIGYLLEVRPIALVKTDLKEFSVEGGATATYNQRYWMGATYRHQEAAIVMAGIHLMADQSLRLAGAYDIIVGGTSVKSPSSYEILLTYVLPAPKLGKKTIVRTPRFRF